VRPGERAARGILGEEGVLVASVGGEREGFAHAEVEVERVGVTAADVDIAGRVGGQRVERCVAQPAEPREVAIGFQLQEERGIADGTHIAAEIKIEVTDCATGEEHVAGGIDGHGVGEHDEIRFK
jgi:hypothetical protein